MRPIRLKWVYKYSATGPINELAIILKTTEQKRNRLINENF